MSCDNTRDNTHPRTNFKAGFLGKWGRVYVMNTPSDAVYATFSTKIFPKPQFSSFVPRMLWRKPGLTFVWCVFLDTAAGYVHRTAGTRVSYQVKTILAQQELVDLQNDPKSHWVSLSVLQGPGHARRKNSAAFLPKTTRSLRTRYQVCK